MFRNTHNDYEEFESVRSGPTQYDGPEEDYNTVLNTPSQLDDASSLNYTHSTYDNYSASQVDDFSRANTTPYDNDKQYDEQTLYSLPNHDDERSSYQPNYSVNGDELSSHQPNYSVHEEEGSFIRPSTYDEEMYDADEAVDTESATDDHRRRGMYEPEEYDSNHPYSNDDRYRDDPDADGDGAEQDALYRTDKYKPSLEQRKKKCCNACVVPACEFRGPWYVLS
jgi:hypothetical protein